MYSYYLVQWLFFFYIYCFFGWCFESTYVSIVDKKLTNRGFMKGPWLPIYGSGAIVILWAALPVKNNIFLVFIVGAFAATILEYVTGVCMEQLFKVRYWDYTNRKWNLNGYICFTSSLCWGGLSIAMIFGFHRPVERFVLKIPLELLSIITFLLTIIIVADFVNSFRTAMDIRDLLIKAEELKEELKHFQKRIDVIEAVIKDELKQRKELKRERRGQRLTELEQDIKERLENFKQPEFSVKLEEFKEELAELKLKHAVNKGKYQERLSKDKYKMLKRNPSAISKKYKDLLEDIKKNYEEKKESEKDNRQ